MCGFRLVENKTHLNFTSDNRTLSYDRQLSFEFVGGSESVGNESDRFTVPNIPIVVGAVVINANE